MHPVIRIAVFFILVVNTTFGSAVQLAVTGVLLLAGYSFGQWHRFPESLIMLKRMRWLFLSILIVYLWFTPGQLAFPDLNAWSPSLEGLQTGIYRVCSLIAIVLAVNLLVRSIERNDLIPAILWLLGPLALIGLPRERLAIRIAMVFDIIGDVQEIYNQKNNSDEKPERPAFGVEQGGLSKRAGAIGVTVVQLFQSVLDRAAASQSHEVELQLNGTPPILQWIYPGILLVMYQFVIMQ